MTLLGRYAFCLLDAGAREGAELRAVGDVDRSKAESVAERRKRSQGSQHRAETVAEATWLPASMLATPAAARAPESSVSELLHFR